MLAVEHPLVRATVSTSARNKDMDSTHTMRTKLSLTKSLVPLAQERMGIRRWNVLVNVPGPMDRLNKHRTVVNRAYHKMHEIVLSCVLSPSSSSAHLCEAPGGFVQCVHDHLATEAWRWIGITREASDSNPRPNMSHLPVNCGHFVIEDVYHVDECIAAIGGRVDLVTADGATDVDHGRMEELHLPLLIAQSKVALGTLAKDGCFVVKFFEGLLPATRRVIGWVSNHFEYTGIIKPTSSRATNSERYLVCQRFLDQTPIPYSDDLGAANEWDVELQTIMNRLAQKQVDALQRLTRE